MKFLLRFLAVVSGLLLLLLAFAVGPIDRRPLESTAEGRATLDALNRPRAPGRVAASLEAGWSRSSIVPSMDLRLAGYGFRGQFNGVHDSLYVQVIALRSVGREVFVINADLMMFPAELAHRIEREIRERYGDGAGCFFTASHTHTGYGNWEPSPAGQIILGRYRSDLVEWLNNRILEATALARSRYQPITVGYRKINAAEWVRNRIDPKAASDGYLRALELKNSRNEHVMLLSYAAHPVNIGDEYRVLSNDYPADLIRRLEATEPNLMVVFAAGMVGSHNPPPGDARDFGRTEWIANGLAGNIAEAPPAAFDIGEYLDFEVHELHLPPPQLRIAQNLRIRPWLFRLLFGPLSANIRILRAGDVLLLGMPCDFSGEIAVLDRLDEYAADKGMHLMITSFNGSYIGYITADRHYDTSRHEEVRVMNWVGPGGGNYFSKIIQAIIHHHFSELPPDAPGGG